MKSFSTLAFLPLLALAHEELAWSVSDIKLPEPLSDMTTTLGPEGLVYVVGGCNATLGNLFNSSSGFYECFETSDSFFSFDAATNKFMTLPSLPRPRYRHGAAFSNNRLWLVGGRNPSPSDDLILEVDVFDFTSNEWLTPGSLTVGTSDNAAFSDANHVYVVGGWDGPYAAALKDVWRITSTSVDTLEMEAVAPLQEARGDIKAVANGRGVAFVAGGFTHVDCRPLSTVEQYDIGANAWTYLDELQSPRADKALVEFNGKLAAIGGETQLDVTCSINNPDPGEATVVIDDVELMNEQGMWEVVVSIPDSRFRFDAVAIGDKIYAFGGQNAYKEDCKCYETTDEILMFTVAGHDDSHPDPSSSAIAANMAVVTLMAVGLVILG